MFKMTIEVKVLFDNGIEKIFYAQTEVEATTKEDVNDYAEENIATMKEYIKQYYKEAEKGNMTVGNNIINLDKTSYIQVALAEIKEI